MIKIKERQIVASAMLISIIAVASVAVIISVPTRETYGTAAAAAAVQQTPPKKILIVTTSHNVLGKTGYPTGVWLPEMTHPFFTLANARFNITIASVKGGNVPIDP